MKVIFSEDALSDILRLREFLNPVAPLAAQKAVAEIVSGCESLATFSARGRVRHDGARQIVVRFGASGYIARYRIDTILEEVVILRVRHARELER